MVVNDGLCTVSNDWARLGGCRYVWLTTVSVGKKCGIHVGVVIESILAKYSV